jgi:PAS domain S-box-containing protein
MAASSFDDPPETASPARAALDAAQEARRGLESEQAFLRRLPETLPYPVSYVDADLVYRQCNTAAAATVGRIPEEVIGRSVASVVGAESEVLGLLRRVLASGEPYSGIVEFTAPGSKSPAAYRVSYLPDIDADGHTVGVLTNVVDVTDLVQAEQALRASEDRLRRIASAGRIGFVEYNSATDEAYWSPEHYELFGFEEGSQVDWQRWLEGVHPEDRERIEASVARLIQRAVADGRVRGHTDEYRFVRPDGAVVLIETDMAADMVDGQPIVRGVVRDVTERKRMESIVRESEEENAFLLRLTDALRPLADPVAVQETASRLLGEHLKADRAAYFEIDDDDFVIERDWAPSVPHLSGRFSTAAFGERLMNAYQSGRMVVINNIAEEPLAPPELEAYLAVMVAAQISMPLIKTGKFVGGLSVHSAAPRAWTPQEMRLLEQTAERTWAALERAKAERAARQADAEIRRLNDELEKRVVTRTAQLDAANKELESFAYSISHDLRAPLRAIDGFSAMVLEDAADKLGEDDREHLQRARAGAQRMAVLIDELLGLSRAGRQEMVLEDVDLSAMAAEVFDELREAQPERRVETVVAPGMRAEADAALLRAILANLLSNSWKFTSRHETARIEVGVTDGGGERVFYVRDDGAGFDAASATHLFGAFQRMHNVDQFEGDGIGLATVERLVTRHGGQVWAEAEVEKGATFYFTLRGATAAI